MTQDAVCKSPVDRDRATQHGLVSEHEGVKYYFCSEPCKREFERQPAMYVRHGRDRDNPGLTTENDPATWTV